MKLSQWAKLQHEIVNAKAWSFVQGFCFAIMCYCLICTYYLLK